MWLTAPLRQRAGAFGDAAEAFLEAWLGPRAVQYRGGREGLLALCREIERFTYRPDVDDEMDRRFVEGAGALLGVLLIDHLGAASHVARGAIHRVQLGAHGFFDPFGAVDRALDAADVRAELARQIESAEAEACNRGPISRLVVSLRSALASERPDLEIEDQFDLTLKLRRKPSQELFELDLKRAVETTCDQEQRAVDVVARRLLSMLPGAAESPLDVAEIEGRMLPRLTRADAVKELSVQGKSVLFNVPLTEDLVVALLIEYAGRARYVRARELESLRLCSEEAFAVAARNLRAKSECTRLVREQTPHGATFVARTGDGRDSARVLLPELYVELAGRVGPEVCIAIPHRDTFLACDGSDSALVQQLARRAAQDAARAPHALSAHLFRLTATGIAG
jgi:uncharacterized protein YtpQ (UPF0354 family)